MDYILPFSRGFIMGNEAEIVRGMKNRNMFTAQQGKLTYMESVSHRIWQTYGHTIRHDKPEHFLSDLDSHGMIDLKAMQ